VVFCIVSLFATSHCPGQTSANQPASALEADFASPDTRPASGSPAVAAEASGLHTRQVAPARPALPGKDSASVGSVTSRSAATVEKSGGAGDAALARMKATSRGARSDFKSYLRTGGALLAVLAVMWLCVALAKKAFGSSTFGGPDAAVQVLSRTYLSNRHQLVLLRVGRRVVLVGLTGSGLTQLAEVSDPVEAAEILAKIEAAKPGSISQEFLQVLKEAQREYEPPEMYPSEVVEFGSSSTDLRSLRGEIRSLLDRVQSLRLTRKAG